MNTKTQILTFASLLSLALIFSNDAQAQGSGMATGPQVQAIQVQPQVQPPVTNPGFIPSPTVPLGVMTHFMSLQRPVQMSGGGASGGQVNYQQNQIQAVGPRVGPPVSNSWAYTGYHIANVTPGSVAQRAGLEVGDIILSLNNRPMTDPYALRSAIMSSQHRNVSATVLNVRTGMPTVVYCSFSHSFPQPYMGGGVPQMQQMGHAAPQTKSRYTPMTQELRKPNQQSVPQPNFNRSR